MYLPGSIGLAVSGEVSSISVTLRKQGAGLGSQGGPSVGEILLQTDHKCKKRKQSWD